MATEQSDELLNTLKTRFQDNPERHPGLDWAAVHARLEANPEKLWSLTQEQYRYLQTLGKFDAKTSSWLNTPGEIRKLGGAIFGDFRFGRVFVYHNGAQSYYGGRGFRGLLRV